MIFLKLNKFLTSVSILALLVEGMSLVIYCDGSGVGLGHVLMQTGRVIAYISCYLKVFEQNYPNP